MKKRFAAMLACAMLFTTLPNHVAAASDNTIVYPNKVVAENTTFQNVTTAPQISIVFKDAIAEGTGYRKEVFYVRVTNAKFIDEMFTNHTVNWVGAESIEKQSDTVVKVVIKPVNRTKAYVIPLLVELTKGSSAVYLESNGSQTTITCTGPNKETTSTDKIAQNTINKEEKPQTNSQNSETKLEQASKSGLEVAFTLGQKSYSINGKSETMDGAMYIAKGGYTMVPIKYVAKALGIEDKQIHFNQGEVTIELGEKKIKLTNQHSTAVVDGKEVSLGTKVVIKEGRTYVPVGQLAKILGVKVQWNQQTKTAVFTN